MYLRVSTISVAIPGETKSDPNIEAYYFPVVYCTRQKVNYWNIWLWQNASYHFPYFLHDLNPYTILSQHTNQGPLAYALESYIENEVRSISTHTNILQQPQTHSCLMVYMWGCMSSNLGSYPSSSLNIRRYDWKHQYFPLLGNKSVEINNLPPYKCKSFKVKFTTSALKWVSNTYWSVPLPVLQWHLILA